MVALPGSLNDDSINLLSRILACHREVVGLTNQAVPMGREPEQWIHLASAWRRLLRLRAFMRIQLGILDRQATRLRVRHSLKSLDDDLFEEAVGIGARSGMRSAIEQVSTEHGLAPSEARKRLLLAREQWSSSVGVTSPDELRADVVRIGPGAVESGLLWPALSVVGSEHREALADALKHVERVVCAAGSLASVLVWSSPDGSWCVRPLARMAAVGPELARAFTLAALSDADHAVEVESHPELASLPTPSGDEPAWRVWREGPRSPLLLEDLTFTALLKDGSGSSGYTLGGRRWEAWQALEDLERL